MKTRTVSFLFASLILANNLSWLALTSDGMGPAVKPDAKPATPPETPCSPSSNIHDKGVLTRNLAASNEIPVAHEEIENQNAQDSVNDIDIAVAQVDSPAPGPQASTRDLPQETSLNYLDQHQIGRDYYDSSPLRERLDTIQSLSTHGDDLSLIEKIVHTEAESALRAAAVSKLAYADSYAATRLLLDGLDDPAVEVRLAALNAIVKTGDRTLIPLLREKLEVLPDGSVRNEVTRSIRQLEYSVTMQMDNLPDK